MARKPAGEKAGKGAGKKKGAETTADNVVPLNAGKEAPASDRKVSTKHNSPEASQETLLRHAGILNAKKAAADKASASYRSARKSAKDEGCNLGDLDAAMKLLKLTTVEARQKHNRLATYLRWLGAPIGEQMSLFDDEGGEITIERVIAEAGAEGRMAASRGEFASANPHDPNSDAGRAWAEEYQKQHALMLGKVGTGVGQTNAEKEAARQRRADF